MSLNFPNQSRSYDSRQSRVRFWAYDKALEISFFVEAEALSQMEPKASRDEPGMLGAFDAHRERICKAADKVYSRHRGGSYTLGAADMK